MNFELDNVSNVSDNASAILKNVAELKSINASIEWILGELDKCWQSDGASRASFYEDMKNNNEKFTRICNLNTKFAIAIGDFADKWKGING